MVAHMTLTYIQCEWRGDHTIHLHGPQSSQWFHVAFAMTYYYFLVAITCLLCQVLYEPHHSNKVLIHLHPHSVINIFKRAFLVFTVIFIYMLIFYINAISGFFWSPQLLITLHRQGLPALCFARASLPLYIRIFPMKLTPWAAEIDFSSE